MLELYNQLSIYIGTKEFKSNFWDIQPMIRSLQPNWKRWQKAWINCIKHYTPQTAKSLRKLVALDIKFMVGCDEEWNFDDAADADAAAAPGPLAPGGEGDDAGASPPPPAGGGAAPNDPYDFTKWDLTDLPSIPLDELLSEENSTASRRSWHAALILIFLSDDIERLHPDVAKKLHAAYKKASRGAGFEALPVNRSWRL